MDLDDERRRAYLVSLAAIGALSILPNPMAQAFWFSSTKKQQLPDGRTFHSIEGEVLVNGSRADMKTRVRAGDRVRTGRNSEAIFAVGENSFLLRSDSEMTIDGDNFIVDALEVITGGLLAVFGKRSYKNQLNMIVSTATIGIRGSGVYAEADPEKSYVCTCYGKVLLAAADDPEDNEFIRSKNHDKPRYITREPVNGSRISAAPIINHTNEELKLLEAIVGRKVPRGFGRYDKY